ncbi:putative RTA1 domain protein [Podospora didyma]|uniref:RTA1 domain protein n=1 Tax=Podospora didyma TaxID=330526 RepID=A0AAE0NX95_9PEZI|nr:putative RTA1 domain protein [Podospora didyma]
MSATASAHAPLITVPYSECNLQLCPIEAAQIPYAPNLAGNVLYLTIFSVALLVNIVLGIWCRTWGYLVSMSFGCILEILGYVGRVQMHFNPFPEDPFLLYLICVTIASIFFTAAVYLCLARIVVVYGENLSILRPRTYTILFIICDFISLVLQAGGGTIVSMADNQAFGDIGLHIMQAGLSFQVASLLVFAALCGLFANACRRRRDERDPNFAELRRLRRFRFFLWSKFPLQQLSEPLYLTAGCCLALSIATMAMLTRCAFRIAELSGGFHGEMWYNEVDYMVLEGAMISICVILLTIGHPGLCFARRYREADFWVRREKRSVDGRH